MSEIRVNEQILNLISINSKYDKTVENFLKDLIYEEVEHSVQWKWKENYRKKIKDFSDKWRENNAD